MKTTTHSHPFAIEGPPRPAALDRLEVFIGRWINEGHTVAVGGSVDSSTVAPVLQAFISGRAPAPAEAT